MEESLPLVGQEFDPKGPWGLGGIHRIVIYKDRRELEKMGLVMVDDKLVWQEFVPVACELPHSLWPLGL